MTADSADLRSIESGADVGFGGEALSAAVPFPFHLMSLLITQGYLPGCIGRITELHADYYSAASGFGLSFEAKVARELAEFCENFEPGRDAIWLLSHQGRIDGSISIDGKGADAAGAHLRWFITSDAVRGQGAGRRLMGEAMRFVDACGYGSTHLWTFAGLEAARHLYESNGFALVSESPGNRWGNVVTEQQFERRTTSGRAELPA